MRHLFLLGPLGGALLMALFGSQMLPFYVIYYGWTAIYALMLVMLWRKADAGTLLPADGPDSLRTRSLRTRSLWSRSLWPRALWPYAAVVVAVRLLFLFKAPLLSMDSVTYFDFVTYLKQGLLPYDGFYFPYPPLFALFLIAVAKLRLGLLVTRTLFLTGDLLACYLVYRAALHLWQRPDRALIAALGFALLPAQVVDAAWNSHFEGWAIALMLLGLLAAWRGRPLVAGLWFGLGAALKLYPVLVAPYAFFAIKAWRDRLVFTLGAMLGFGGPALYFLVKTPHALIAYLTSYIPLLYLVTGGNSGLSGGAMNSLQALFSDMSPAAGPWFGKVVTLWLPLVLLLYALVSVTGRRRKPALLRALLSAVVLAVATGAAVFGVLTLIYPSLHTYTRWWWWLPPPIALLRGGTIVLAAGILASQSTLMADAQDDRDLARDAQGTLGTWSSLTLVTAALSVPLLYGWYTLVAAPFAFLQKRLAFALSLVLLVSALYPVYFETDFHGLGFRLPVQWQANLADVGTWQTGMYQQPVADRPLWTADANWERVDTPDRHIWRTAYPNLGAEQPTTLLIEADAPAQVRSLLFFKGNRPVWQTPLAPDALRAGRWLVELPVWGADKPDAVGISGASAAFAVKRLSIVPHMPAGLADAGGALRLYMDVSDVRQQGAWMTAEQPAAAQVGPDTWMVAEVRSSVNPTFGSRLGFAVSVDGADHEGQHREWRYTWPLSGWVSSNRWLTYRVNLASLPQVKDLASIDRLRLTMTDLDPNRAEGGVRYIDVRSVRLEQVPRRYTQVGPVVIATLILFACACLAAVVWASRAAGKVAGLDGAGGADGGNDGAGGADGRLDGAGGN